MAKQYNLRKNQASKSVPARALKQKIAIIFANLFLLVLVISLMIGVNYLRKPENFPVKVIKINATYQHTGKSQLQETILPLIKGNFFTVQVGKLKQALSDIPWVNSVAINRVWPDELAITIAELQPVAKWGKNGLLTSDAQLFYPAPETIPAGLPLLKGPDGQAALVWQVYQRVTNSLAPLNLSIAELELNARHAWRMRLSNGALVMLGRLDFDQRLSRLLQVYPKIFAGKPAPKSIDLRYNNGLSVKW